MYHVYDIVSNFSPLVGGPVERLARSSRSPPRLPANRIEHSHRDSIGRSHYGIEPGEAFLSLSALIEIGIGVTDLEKSLELYGRVLGFETVWKGALDSDDARVVGPDAVGSAAAILTRPEVPTAPRLRLVETTGPPGRPPGDTAAIGPLGIGFTCGDISLAHRRLEEAGVRFSSPPVELTPEPEEPDEDLTGPRRFEAFGQADDGELLVLIERRNVPDAYGTLSDEWLTSEPLHTSHVVADLTAASRFLVEAMEHQVIFRELCQGEEFERLMGLGPGARFRFEMLRHPAHHTGRIILIEYIEPPDRSRDRRQGEQRPSRGIHALRYDCTDLAGTLEAAIGAGAEVLCPPVRLRSGPLGSGTVAVLDSPIGLPLELSEPLEGGEG